MVRVLLATVVVLAFARPAAADRKLQFAGSVQLDYLAVPTQSQVRQSTFDGATTELSLRLAAEFSDSASAQVKVCFACHGFEDGMSYVELRAADELRLRVGRMTPELGAFPSRHDPANHDTSDKPLPYDMGRMLRLREWNEGVLPAPWVDNGIEIIGTHFMQGGEIDYAAYLVSGPKGPANATDFDLTMSRSPAQYYVDNNSQPSAGARLWGTITLGPTARVVIGASGMAGRYDPEAHLGFAIVGGDFAVQSGGFVLRAEYLARWTQMALGADPGATFKYGPVDGKLADYFIKDGFYAEAEQTFGRVSVIARWDGLRRKGNLPTSSMLRSESAVLRYTVGVAVRTKHELRVKLSGEYYDFSDFADAPAIHIGIAAPF